MIFSLKIIKLKILKTYIKTILTNRSIRLFKSLNYNFILFTRKKTRVFVSILIIKT